MMMMMGDGYCVFTGLAPYGAERERERRVFTNGTQREENR
jgi:hypothetical protein